MNLGIQCFSYPKGFSKVFEATSIYITCYNFDIFKYVLVMFYYKKQM